MDIIRIKNKPTPQPNQQIDTNRLSVDYCYGGTAQYSLGEVLGPRLLTDFEIVMIIEGHARYESQGHCQQLNPGTILVARPGRTETYFWDSSSPTRHAYLHLDITNVPDDWPALEVWPDILLNPPPILGRLFQHIVEHAVSQPNWPTQQPKLSDIRTLETFLDLYLKEVDTQQSKPHTQLSEPAQRAAQFMRERLDSSEFVPFTLDEIAEAAHVSSKHLCRIFTKELGVAPMKASRLMQFQLAIPLLARSNLRIKEISRRCGFPDQLHFSRSFSHAFGQSPSQIKKELARGKPPPATNLPPALMPRLYW